MASKLCRYVLECSALWLCDSADNIRSKKFNMAGMWPWVPKQLSNWETAKNILFHSKLISPPLFGENVNILTAPVRSFRRCGQFDMGVTICVWWLATPQNSLARGLKYFYNVELLYPLDKFTTNWIFYRGNVKQNYHFYCEGDTIKKIFLFYVSLLKI